MDSILIAAGSAVWLGILTSISPCPLATNIAAITYVSKRVARPGLVLMSGLLYMLGRMISYFVVAILVIESLFSSPSLSMFLQQNVNRILGPVMLVVGVLIIDFFPWPWVGRGFPFFARLQGSVDRLGIWGAGLLGLVFALTFCPLSAALFFGSLIPVSVKFESSVLLPSLYGIGTALPVVVFAVILAFAANRLSKAFDAMTAIEKWMRRLTSVVFIVIGAYYCLSYTFGII